MKRMQLNFEIGEVKYKFTCDLKYKRVEIDMVDSGYTAWRDIENGCIMWDDYESTLSKKVTDYLDKCMKYKAFW